LGEKFLTAFKMIFDSTYFQFDNYIYKQNFGTSMDSPLSLVITNLVIRDLKEKVLEILGFRLPFYFRYVDRYGGAFKFYR